MKLAQRIQTILADDRLDDEASGISKAETIEALIKEHGWEPVQSYLLQILVEEDQSRHWRTAAEVFWGAVLDRRPLPVDKLIALLYYRFDPLGVTEDNLVWSITSQLKGVGYLSDYDPLEDPGVLAEYRALRRVASV